MAIRPNTVGLELIPVTSLVAFLERGQVAIAGIVDEHVHVARHGNGRRDIIGGGHVERERGGIGMARDQIAELLGFARGGEHMLAARDQDLGERAAKAGGATRNEPGTILRHDDTLLRDAAITSAKRGGSASA